MSDILPSGFSVPLPNIPQGVKYISVDEWKQRLLDEISSQEESLRKSFLNSPVFIAKLAILINPSQ